MVTIREDNLAKIIEEETGNNLFLCYQCKKCTSGCPLSEHFDLTPHQVIRALQLGRGEETLSSATIWLCASCQTCNTRCPQGLDLPRIMDRLKALALERAIPPKVPQVALFNDLFLQGIRLLGRSYELGLMVGRNLRTGQPFKDLPLGLEFFRKGKLKIMPRIVRGEGKPRKAEPDQLAYYPGCSLHSTASEYDISTRAVFEELGIQLVEPRGWTCCGSTPAHATDHLLATRMALRNLALMERSGHSEAVVACAGCYARFKATLWDLRREKGLKERLDEEMGYQFQDKVEVRNVLEVLRARLPQIEERVKRPLKGLKVACYYGCVLTRPPEVTGVQEPENPQMMEELLGAVGASPLDWSYKTECCGATLGLTKTELALELSAKVLKDAKAAGAEVVALACPLCHANLDARQRQMGLGFQMPILYITQLVGLGLGIGKLGLEKHLVDPRNLLRDKGFLKEE